MHSHAHGHSHGHHGGTGGRLQWSLVATWVFAAVEVVAGLRAHSLALLSDAGHNFTDALALLLAWIAYILQTRPANKVKTYGYQRAGVLAAFVNALILVALSAWIFYESAMRLKTPQNVGEATMIAVASIGVLLNGAVMLALRAASRDDLNVRSAFVHMLGDALGSAAIVLGGVVIYYTGWGRVDPLLSILIGVLIVWSAWDIIRESLNILLEGLPRGIRLNDVEAGMRLVEGVLDVHDLHIWSLGSSSHALSCHVRIADVPPSASEAILRAINAVLADQFHIAHTTVQFEHVGCAISENGCCPIPTPEPAHGHEHRHHH